MLTPAEAALVEATADLRGGVRAPVIERLRKLSGENAGEEVSGLAQLLVAKSSLSIGRFEDAATAARHPDIDRTALGDRALLILAQAKARAADYGGSASAYLRAVDAARETARTVARGESVGVGSAVGRRVATAGSAVHVERGSRLVVVTVRSPVR